MKKNILYLLLLIFICSTRQVSAQCDLPDLVNMNTGSNMTVFFTSDAVADLPISSDAPYMVAISSSGVFVGSASFASEDLIGGQQSLAVWGDDTGTTELDGALAGEQIHFQLVDGFSLYDVSVVTVMGSSITYTTNSQAPLVSSSSTLVCEPNFCDQWYGHTTISSSDANMSVILSPDFISSLGIENPILSPDLFEEPVNTGANMTVGINSTSFDPYVGSQIGAFYDLNGDGSLECVGLETISTGFFGLPLWGDDASTPDVDGLPADAVPEFAILHDGEIIFVGEVPEFSGYVTNGIVTIFEVNLSTSLPYVVAVTQNNLVVGSIEVLNGAQAGLVIYSDDPTTDDIDGAQSGEVLSLYFLQDNEIFSLSTSITYQDGQIENISQPDNPVSYCLGLEPFGCMDPSAFNYNSAANTDDGSCEDIVEGCTDVSAFNFSPTANVNDGTCIAVVNGCIDNGSEISGSGQINDLDDDGLPAFNYNPLANTDDETCVAIVNGCIDNGSEISGSGQVNDLDGDGLSAFNFNPSANTDDGTCIAIVSGCIDNGSEISGSGQVNDLDEDGLPAFNYNPLANTDDGSCVSVVTGCMDDLACNYNTTANTDDNSCLFPSGCETCSGEIDGSGTIVDNDNDDDGVCDLDELEGCTDETACNYDATPTTDTENDLCIYTDGVCQTCSGEIDGTGIVIDNDDDGDGYCNIGSGISPEEVLGCDNIDACDDSFDPVATEDDGSCLFFDDCGVCDGNNDCAIFIQDEIQITIDESLVSDNQAIQIFSENFEGLMETQLGLADGTVVVLSVTIDGSNRGEVNVTVDYTITLTEEELEVSSFDPNSTFEEIKDQINLNIVSIESGPVFSNLAFIEGCTDPLACNYNIEANIEDFNCVNKVSEECDECSGEQDGSGTLIQLDIDGDGICAADELEGCTDNGLAINGFNQVNDLDGDGIAAINYNPDATDDDGSCITQVLGCTNSDYLEYWSYDPDLDSQTPSASVTNLDPIPNTDDGSCDNLIIYGCMDFNAINYDELANVDIPDGNEGACIPYATGCTNPNACNTTTGVINVISECDFPPINYFCDYLDGDEGEYVISCINDSDGDGVCDENEIEGCIVNSFACNYNLDATDIIPCEFPNQFYDCSNVCINDSDSDGICDENEISGCQDVLACNFDANATDDDGSCFYSEQYYDCDGVCLSDSNGNSICDELEIYGCMSNWADNYLENATTDDGSCYLLGCNDPSYIEYDVNVTQSNGSCNELVILGCMDESACNFNSQSNVSDGSCSYPELYQDCQGSCINGEDIQGNCIDVIIEGCLDEVACNYNPDANTETSPSLCFYFTEYRDCNDECYFDEDNDGVCDQQEIFGCLDENACNFNEIATESSTCLYPVEVYLDCNNECISDLDGDGVCDQVDVASCNDELAENFEPFTTEVDNSLCIYPTGCTDSDAANYNPSATQDDGSCITIIIGCTDAGYLEYNPVANTNDLELCVNLVYEGCMNENASNYDPQANFNTYECEFDTIFGCISPNYLEYNPNATSDSIPSLCQELIIEGCTNPNFLDYDPLANVDNGTCQTLEYVGCTDSTFQEYDPLFTVNDQNLCITPHIYGCTNPFSQGGLYNSLATVDDGSCVLIGCSDPNYAEYHTQGFIPNNSDDPDVIQTFDALFCNELAIFGCTNDYANNFNPDANVATDECEYGEVDDADYYDFSFVATEISMSIILPYYPLSNSLSVSNVEFTGDISEPFEVGSKIGVFFRDHNLQLVCGGSSVWTDSTNFVSAFADDSYTQSSKDGFDDGDVLEWYVVTPAGLLYGLTVDMVGGIDNVFNGGALLVVDEIDAQFIKQVNVPGCMDSLYLQYNPYANVFEDLILNFSHLDSVPGLIDGSDNVDDDCVTLRQIGCMDPSSFNYNPNATEDNGSCYPKIYGCINPTAFNYVEPIGNIYVDPNTNDGSCFPVISGCKDDNTAFNYIPLIGDPSIDINTNIPEGEPGSCYPVVLGCNDFSAFNYNDYDGDGLANAITGIDGIDVNTDDGSCIPKVFGCMTEGFFNYNPLANIDTEVCYPVITGCTDDENAINYIAVTGNPYQDVNNFVPCIFPRLGCMDSLAYNYDPLATMHDESCISRTYGCIDETAFNYDAESNTDDGSCYPIILGCMDENAFNYNNYGSDKFIGYDLTDVYTNVNTPDDSCIPINEGCLDLNAANYNDFDLDGEANLDSSSFDPYQKINTHRQADCFYRPGCTDQNYAQYWNYSIIEGLDRLLYPDSMINFDESCIDIAEFFCNDPTFVEHYIVENNFISTYSMSLNDAFVPMQSECINVRIDYCSDSNYEGYYFTDNIIDGSDIDQGANFPISPVAQFYSQGNDLNPEDAESLCGNPVSFYCNNSSFTGYYASDNSSLTMKDSVGGNIIDDSLCGEIPVELYCSDSSYVGYYNTNTDGIHDFVLGHNTGNIDDQVTCGDLVDNYCNDPLYQGYYSTNTVENPYIGNLIHNEEACGDLATFYCSDPEYLGYYLEDDVDGQIAFGSHIDNSTEYCLEPIDSYCSDSTYFEYYIDYSVSFDPYIGNIKDVSKCLTLINPGCMDETMFNYDANANVNQFSLTDRMDPCYPIVYGCLDTSAYNFNNYYSNLNINPATGNPYNNGDETSLDFGANMPQDSVYSSLSYDGSGNGINVNTSLPNDPSSLYSGGCIPVVEGCTDLQALNYNDWSPIATDSTDYGDGLTDSWNYENPWLNINTDDGSCIPVILGCTDSTACNYNQEATVDIGTCSLPDEYYDCDGNCLNDADGNNVCDELEILGCTDNGLLENALGIINDEDGDQLASLNYNSLATQDDGSCITIIEGCMTEGFFNYDDSANSPGYCEPELEGCADSTKFNYDPAVNIPANEYCVDIVLGCIIPAAYNFNDYDGDGESNPLTNILGIDVNTYLEGSCITRVYGCTDASAINYDETANTDNGTCIGIVPGCTDVIASNYNFEAVVDDGSCLYEGCTNPTAFNYNANFDISCSDCCIVSVTGCMNETAFNYDPTANVPGFCIDVVLGCMDNGLLENGIGEVSDLDGDGLSALNYMPNANTPSDDCITKVFGCTNPQANGYNAEAPANVDDGSCIIPVSGCTDSLAVNFEPFANQLDNSCLYLGCTDNTAANWNSQANIDDGSCVAVIIGCTDNGLLENALGQVNDADGDGLASLNYNPLATVDNGNTCITVLEGCTNPLAQNFNPSANVDDGSCQAFVYGCTDPNALNYNSNANTNQVSQNNTDNPCIDIVYGCMYSEAMNYNPSATVDTDPTSCVLKVEGCTDGTTDDGNPIAINYNEFATIEDGSCVYISSIPGCTNPLACNYDLNATEPDGTCVPCIYGCNDPTAINYDPNVDSLSEGSCIEAVVGCLNPLYVEFNSLANIDDTPSLCSTLITFGCTDPEAANFNEFANTNQISADNTDDPCIATILGCTIPGMPCYDSNANTLDASSCFSCPDLRSFRTRSDTIVYCSDDLADNYNVFFDASSELWGNSQFNPDNSSSIFDCNYDQFGYDIFCTDGNGSNYALQDDECQFISGCTDNGNNQNNAGIVNDIDGDGLPAFNYNPEAVLDDGSCEPIIIGCADNSYLEYDATVNVNSPGTCLNPVIAGCTDVNAFNFDLNANQDDGSCIPIITGCLDDNYVDYDENANTPILDESGNNQLCVDLIVYGCTDLNYIEYWDYDSDSYSLQSDPPTPNFVHPNTDDGSCSELVVLGCADSTYIEYWDYSNNTLTPSLTVANVNDGSCSNLILEGCTDFLYIEYSSDNNVSDPSQCVTPILPGCTNDQYLEYNASYNIGEDNVYCLTPIVLGCTNENADNYNELANVDDGSCIGVAGCTDASADNFDSGAAADDGSCEFWGCTNPNAANYDATATHNITSAEDSSSPCIVLGCMDGTEDDGNPIALNYNDLDGDAVADPLTGIDGVDVNIDDGSCIYQYVYGCMDPDASNYDALATLNQVGEADDSDPCIPYVYGCTDDTFVEYYDFVFSNTLQYEISGPINIPNQDTDPSSCVTPIIEGCTDASFLQYVDSANVYDASACIDLLVVGCQVDTYLEYNPEANFGDEATYCLNLIITGCMNPNYLEYDSLANDNDISLCVNSIVNGCIDSTAFNYNELANVDDGSCVAVVNGCTDNGFDINGSGQVDDIDGDGLPAFNYDSLANIDDGSCEAIVEGCTDANFIENWNWDEANFTLTALDPIPNTDDGSCSILRIDDCKDPLYIEYNVDANVSDSESCINLIVEGCTDDIYLEYDPNANTDDGSCFNEIVLGCTDQDYLEYYGFVDFIVPVDLVEYLTAVSGTDIIANVDDGSCVTPIVQGCFNELASNHDTTVTVHDVSSCQGAFGCMLSNYIEYNELALIDNGSCLTEIVYGCIDDGSSNDGSDDFHYDLDGDGLSAYNYNPLANTNDSSCYPIIEGCFDETAYNYNDYDYDNHPNESSGDVLVDINTNNPSDCIPKLVGCYSDNLAFNYNDYDNDGFANTLVGDPSIDINTDSLGFCYPVVEGCMDDINAFNYNDYTGDNITDVITGINGVDVNTDDGSCFPFVLGCMDQIAYNYNDYDYDGEANELTNVDGTDINTDDGSCFAVVYGCMNDPSAFNYNDYSGNDSSNVITGTPGIDVNTDDGSCFPVLEGCLDGAAFNFNDYDNDGFANELVGDLSVDVNTHNLSLCEYEGCTNFSAINYDDAGFVQSDFGFLMPATIDDGSCNILGCTLENFPNYNEEATIEDGSCDMNSSNVYGCTDENYLEFTIQGFVANVNNGSCRTPIVYGCIDNGSITLDEVINITGENGPDNFDDDYHFDLDGDLLPAFNFDSTANTNDGSCIPMIFGCTDEDYLEFSSEYNTLDLDQCQTQVIFGCTNEDAINYDPLANSENGTCDVEGCTDQNYLEYDVLATLDDNSCQTQVILGCTDSNYLEYWNWQLSPFNDEFYILFEPLNANVNSDDGSCVTELFYGCIYSSYTEYNPNTNVPDNDLCQVLKEFGCTNELASNFNAAANVDDGSCIIEGCTNVLSFNYNLEANLDNGSCIPSIYGCTIEIFANYNPNANIDNGTCSDSQDIMGCMDDTYYEYDSLATINNSDYCLNIMVFGCMDDTMKNYNPNANFDDGSCIPIVLGCMNSDYLNYNSNANTNIPDGEPGACSGYIVPGCSDPFAFNYNIVSDSTWLANNPDASFNQNVNLDDGSCIPIVLGCLNPDYLEYYNQDTIANTGEDSVYCFTLVNSGCTDPSYLEYYIYDELSPGVFIIDSPIDTTVNFNDGSCNTLIVEGCMYDMYQEFNPMANISKPEQCITQHVYGCMNPEADNFNALATSDNGLCFVEIIGCMDEDYLEYNPLANTTTTVNGQDVNCETLRIDGCNNSNYLQFYNYTTLILQNQEFYDLGDPLNDGANVFDGCIDSLVYGCPYSVFVEYDSLVNVFESGTPSCQTIAVEGCTDEAAINFDINANIDNGSCIASVFGCTDNSYVEFNPFANVDDSSCNNLTVLGCDEPDALNYDPLANTNDGSCEDVINGCTDSNAYNYNSSANVDDGSCVAIVLGCTDNGYSLNALGVINDANNDQIAAINFNPEANTDDGSCIPVIYGCTDSNAYNFNDYNNDGHPDSITGDVLIDVNTDDGSCVSVVEGCIDPTAFNYSSDANVDDGSCYPIKYGCLDATAYNYNDYDGDNIANPLSEIDSININTDNGVCFPIAYGCIDCDEDDGTPIANNCQPNFLLANTDDGSCQYFGCMDPLADNYDPIYNVPSEEACEYFGCTDSQALNYIPIANYDDGSCEYLVFGCTDSLYIEYNSLANQSDGSCQILARYGCMDLTAKNYDASANINQLSFSDSLSDPCIPFIWGCMDDGSPEFDINGDSLAALNYNSIANTDDGSCIVMVFGCMNPSAMNYNPQANVNDSSCESYIYGCTNEDAFNFNENANTDDGSCIEKVFGCLNPLAFNYNSAANTNDQSCVSYIYGCSDEEALNYNPTVNTDDGSCIEKVFGCLNPLADNYNSLANTNDGSCIAVIFGCTDINSVNYNPNATQDNNSCVQLITGCINPFASNYNDEANQDDGSCVFGIEGCTDPTAFNYQENATLDDGSCEEVVLGCTWDFANNFNPLANTDDGSCTFVVVSFRAFNPKCIDPTADNYFPYADPNSANYVGDDNVVSFGWIIDNVSCSYTFGCTDPNAFNYDPDAGVDDGSCIDESNQLIGCMDENYLEYNENANINNTNLCITPVVLGCTDINAINYNPVANVDDDSCSTSQIDGCTDPSANNYNPNATDDDDSCDYENLNGCTDPNYLEYNSDTECETLIVSGCTDQTADNYDPEANTDNGSCYISGCTESSADNYDMNATQNDGSCIYNGCIDQVACNWDIEANTDDGSCTFAQTYYDCNGDCLADSDGDNICDELELSGCTDDSACNYNANATDDDVSCNYAETYYNCNGDCISDTDGDNICDELEVVGCEDALADNYDATATDPGTCEYEGCTDSNYLEYNSNANVDDGSCETIIIFGCTNELALNYEASANQNDGSCNILGCTEPSADNYNALANQDDDSCIIFGCVDSVMFNYNSLANVNDGSCYVVVQGCMDQSAFNYNDYNYDGNSNPLTGLNGVDVNTDNGSCIPVSEGCSDSNAFNFDPSVNTDDGTCIDVVEGCTDIIAYNFDDEANTDDGSCIEVIEGCMDLSASNYNPSANTNDGSCIVIGCTNPTAQNYNTIANQDDGSCLISGCTTELFDNYNPAANVDDGSCSFDSGNVFGCTDVLYIEYSSNANVDNGTCNTLIVEGCIDLTAFNYNPDANTDDGSCYPIIEGCLQEDADNFSTSNGNVQNDVNTNNETLCIYYGCMDDNFPNYNPVATTDDGSCSFISEDVFGCTDSDYLEYDTNATVDNGTCNTLIVEGCTDNGNEINGFNQINDTDEDGDAAINYNPFANVDDGSCITKVEGCTNSLFIEYNSAANTDDASCSTLIVLGCTDNGNGLNALGQINDIDLDELPALNYNPNANTEDNSCITQISGCTDPLYLEYDSDANVDDNSCSDLKIYGCTDSTYLEYWHYIIPPGSIYYSIGNAINPGVNFDDGSCNIPLIVGCVYDLYVEYNSEANVVDMDSCLTEVVEGCIFEWADNYNSSANTDDNSCYREGCMLDWADNYDPIATDDDESCYKEGCTSDWADNYDPIATDDDESCYKEGCTSDWADNYDLTATDDDESCYKMGCKWFQATNFDFDVTDDDGSCYREGCMSDWADNTDPYFNFNAPYPVEYIDNGSCTLNACMSDWADNYDINATSDTTDGSCFKEGCMLDWADNYDSLATQNTLTENECYRMGCMSDWADNYDPLVTDDDGTCYKVGCTLDWADNYDEYATIDDGLCGLNACMSDWADNYDEYATIDDGSCYREGCMSDWADNYDPLATNDDESCYKEGCVSDWADNYDEYATIDDGSCYREGCMLEWANSVGGNYDSLATINDGSCFLNGCVYDWADNYNSNANIDDGSCYKEGCTSDWADNYDPIATIDNGLCELNACMSDWADNFDEYATIDDGSCVKEGCMSDWADNYDEYATIDDGSCVKEGCMSEWADNYDVNATSDTINGSCQLLGCTDSVMFNYDSLATQNDGSCYPIIPGCLDPDANNYFELTGNNYSDPNTQCDNCCLYFGCMDSLADNYDPIHNVPSEEDPCLYPGCTDQEACNWDNEANIDDGSCFIPELYYNCLGLCINDVDADGVCDELEQYGCTDELAVNYDSLATEDNALCYYPLQVDLVVNNAACKGGLGSVELNITGGLEPIEINTFGLDITAIPPGDGYVIHVSDASGNNYSFGGSEYNFTPSFSITEPQEQLQLVVGYNQADDQIYFVTNADAPEFTWYFNNVVDESINTDSFTPQENGVYGVDITDEFGCSLFEDILYESVSISELSIESLEVYPNPANGWVNIKYDLPKNISSTIRLISLTGKLIYKIDLEANNRVEQLIPLFDISAGVYLVEIEIDDQKLYRRLSIK